MKESILSQLLIKCPFPEVFEDNTPRALIDWMYLALLYSLQAAGAIPQARWEIDVSSWCLSS